MICDILNMDYDSDTDTDVNVHECDYKQFIRTLMESPPDSKNSHSIIPQSDDDKEHNYIYFAFDLLLNIYMESIMIILEKKQMDIQELLSQGTEHFDSSVFYELLMSPNPWFNSFGFNIVVNNYDNDNEDDETYFNEHAKNNYYTRITLRSDKKYKLYFEMNNIESLYYFFRSGEHNPTNNLENVHAIYSNNKSNYVIFFRKA